MAKQQLPHFGIHEDADGVRHLFQDLCPDGFNYVGIKGSTGMSVRKCKKVCSHAVIPTLGLRNLPDKHWYVFQQMLSDNLVKVMLPMPTQGRHSCYIGDNNFEGQIVEYLSCLERMSTPLISSVKPLWAVNLAEIKALLGLTNLHPLVLYGAKEEDSPLVARLLELSRSYPRRLVICGTDELILPKQLNRMKSSLIEVIKLSELISLPLEHIGGEIIKRYCRYQDFRSPLTR